MFVFPKIKAWRNAVLLFMPAYGAATVVFMFLFWLFFITFCILLPWYEPALLFFLVMALIVLLAGAIWYLLVLFLYSSLLRLLWDKPPSWLKSPPSFKANLVHLGVLTFATLPIVVIYVIHLYWIEHIEVLTTMDYKSLPVPDVMLKLSWLWVIAAAYGYQWQYLLSSKQNQK